MSPLGDLVVATIPGVGRFLSESRTTADVFASSHVLSDLAAAMVAAAEARDGKVVLPAAGEGDEQSTSATGLPNRVVVQVESNSGSNVAEAMAAAVRRRWNELVATGVQIDVVDDADVAEFDPDGTTSATPGFPAVQWVVIPTPGEGEGSYPKQWERAVRALTARKRVRDFPGYSRDSVPLCSLTARWAGPQHRDPQRSGIGRLSSRPRHGEVLSTVAQVKRAYREIREQHELDGASRRRLRFPSTSSVATTPFREAVITTAASHTELVDKVADLRAAVQALHSHGVSVGSSDVPALDELRRELQRTSPELAWLAGAEGLWCYPESWEPRALRRDFNLDVKTAVALEGPCENGRKAARRLIEEASRARIPPPSSYLALIAQDADHMGQHLGSPPPDRSDMRAWHGKVSRGLLATASAQSQRLEERQSLGRTVYAGGDDFLGFVPVRSALKVATGLNELSTQELRRVFGETSEVSVSSAVAFFHIGISLQSVIPAARELLEQAKEHRRPGAAVAVYHRGGERAKLIQPYWAWRSGTEAPEQVPLLAVVEELTQEFRSGLSGRLAQRLERDTSLWQLRPQWCARELRRLIDRHSSIDGQGTALLDLAASGAGEPGEAAIRTAVAARFIASETKVQADTDGEEGE